MKDHNYLPQITPEMAGVIWLPDQEDVSKDSYFTHLDYLCDGVISHYEQQHHKDKKPHLFFTHNFSDTFFVLFLPANEEGQSPKIAISNELKLCSNHTSETKKCIGIACVNKERADEIERLIKKNWPKIKVFQLKSS